MTSLVGRPRRARHPATRAALEVFASKYAQLDHTRAEKACNETITVYRTHSFYTSCKPQATSRKEERFEKLRIIEENCLALMKSQKERRDLVHYLSTP